MHKLQLQPRPEEVPVSEANVVAAEATDRLEKDQYERGKKLRETTGVITEEEFISREKAFEKAEAELTLARASLALLKAGAWKADIDIAVAAVEQAKAQVDQAKVALDLLLIRAPVDGTILQINVRPGEFISMLAGQSLVLMGNTSPLHVRVNIDEEDLPRLPRNAPAQAKIRGNILQQEISLTFVRVEPYVVPKVSLTGINTERVDTLVVQVIYAVDPNSPLVKEHKVLVGQLVDVFIDTRPSNSSGLDVSSPKR